MSMRIEGRGWFRGTVLGGVVAAALATGCGGSETAGNPGSGGAGAGGSNATAGGSNATGGSECPGAERCGDVCVDTSVDPANCGGCHQACDAGAFCSKGKCIAEISCGEGTTKCGDACVDLSTDIDNCGACGNACEANAPATVTCDAGRCHERFDAPGSNALAVDATTVYWSDSDKVHATPASGGPTKDLTSGEDSPSAIAVGPTNVYWISGGIHTNPVYVEQAPKDGSGAATNVASNVSATALALDATYLYWAGYAGVYRWPIDGSAAPNQIAPAPGGEVYGLAVDASNAYFSTFKAGGDVYSVPLAGGAVTPIATGQTFPHRLATRNGKVFFADYGNNNMFDGSVQEVATTGGSTTELASYIEYANDVAAAGTNVFFLSAGSGILGRIDLSTPGSYEVLVQGQPRRITTDAKSVYWTDSDTVQTLTWP